MDAQHIGVLQKMGRNRHKARYLGIVRTIGICHVALALQKHAIEPYLVGIADTGQVDAPRLQGQVNHRKVQFKHGLATLAVVADIPVIGQFGDG